MSTPERSRSLVSRVMAFAVGSLDQQPAQSDRPPRIALAGEPHPTVLEHGETIALRMRDEALTNDVEAHVGLRPGNENRTLVGDRGPPAVVAMAPVKDNSPCQRHRSLPARG